MNMSNRDREGGEFFSSMFESGRRRIIIIVKAVMVKSNINK